MTHNITHKPSTYYLTVKSAYNHLPAYALPEGITQEKTAQLSAEQLKSTPDSTSDKITDRKAPKKRTRSLTWVNMSPEQHVKCARKTESFDRNPPLSKTRTHSPSITSPESFHSPIEVFPPSPFYHETHADGSQSIFSLLNGMRQGPTICTFPNGTTVQSQYVNGHLHGHGIETNAVGTTRFRFEFDQRQGPAHCVFHNGNQLSFSYLNSSLQGPATLTISNLFQMNYFFYNGIPFGKASIHYRNFEVVFNFSDTSQPKPDAMLFKNTIFRNEQCKDLLYIFYCPQGVDPIAYYCDRLRGIHLNT